jgi:hypothetical protein
MCSFWPREALDNLQEISDTQLLAIFLVRGAKTQKNGLKTHLSKVSDDNAPKISHEQV